MTVLIIMILWTWGLTPVWVNVVGTILMAFTMLGNLVGSTKSK